MSNKKEYRVLFYTFLRGDYRSTGSSIWLDPEDAEPHVTAKILEPVTIDDAPDASEAEAPQEPSGDLASDPQSSDDLKPQAETPAQEGDEDRGDGDDDQPAAATPAAKKTPAKKPPPKKD